MELFRIRKDIPFMRHAIVLNAISFITFLLAVFFLTTRGLNLSVEFTGGTVMEVAYEQPADLESVRKVIEGLGYADVPVQNFGTSRDVLLRLPVQAGQIVGSAERRPCWPRSRRRTPQWSCAAPSSSVRRSGRNWWKTDSRLWGW